MPKAPGSRGPLYKHDILSAPLPIYNARRRSKRNGEPASHRTACTIGGLSTTNRGKVYLTVEKRKQIFADDPTTSFIEGVTNAIYCVVCEEIKELENDRFLLTGWFNHTRTVKHRENARNHLDHDDYFDWLEWVKEYLPSKPPKAAAPRRSTSSSHSPPSYYTPPPALPATVYAHFVPAPAFDQYAPSGGSQYPAFYDEDDDEGDDYAENPESLEDSFRLRPALWTGNSMSSNFVAYGVGRETPGPYPF